MTKADSCSNVCGWGRTGMQERRDGVGLWEGEREGHKIEDSVISGFPGSLMLGLDFDKCQPLIPICLDVFPPNI